MSRKERIYSIAFRRRRSTDDFFYLNDDYCFEEYHVDLGGRYWLADPFLFDHDGKTYVFYEAFDMIRRIGRLGYSIINPDTKTLTPPKIILKRPYHFSWPYIFEHDGEIYILPETGQDWRVKLFRAVKFPDVWTEDEILINDIHSCDSILLGNFTERGGGIRYLITSEEYHNTPNGEIPSCRVKNMLFEFMPGEKLKLKPNGKINPEGIRVAEGDYGIRNAGKVFVSDGKLIRPGQDCRELPGVKTSPYGRGIVLFRIDSIEPYSEKEIFSVSCESIGTHLKPLTGEDIVGLHTYNLSRDFEVVDFVQMKQAPFKTRTLRRLRDKAKVVKRFLVDFFRR